MHLLKKSQSTEDKPLVFAKEKRVLKLHVALGLAESGEKRIRDGARIMVQGYMEKKKKKKNHRWGFF